MTKSVDFYFDFASPNAYLAHRVLSPICAELGADLVIKPALLGGIFKATDNAAPFARFGHIANKMKYMQIEFARFIARHGLSKFQMNPHFPINTVLLMRGLLVAEKNGVMDAYIEAGLTAMWEEGLNMGDAAVFVEAMTNAGLDGQALAEGTQDQAIKDDLRTRTEAAVARGLFGIPTFFVGDEMFFGKDRLLEVQEALEA